MIERGMMIMIERDDDKVLTLCGMKSRHVIVLHLQLDELKKIIRMMMVMIVMIIVMIVLIMMIEMTMTIVHSPSCFVSLSQAVVAARPHPAVSLLSTYIIVTMMVVMMIVMIDGSDDRW